MKSVPDFIAQWSWATNRLVNKSKTGFYLKTAKKTQAKRPLNIKIKVSNYPKTNATKLGCLGLTLKIDIWTYN